jgi:toxin CcdB
MARFDVYRGVGGADLLLDCQSDLLRDLNTRFVVPLMRRETAPQPARRLNPIFRIEDHDYVMVTQFAGNRGRFPCGQAFARLTSIGNGATAVAPGTAKRSPRNW